MSTEPHQVHASLAAYPDAVISLKDRRTDFLFYVESNGRRLVAFDNAGKVLWSVDVLDETKVPPAAETPVIRHLRLDGEILWVTCGKSESAKVSTKSGKVEHAGGN